jgi:hypothetical protein
MHFNNGLRGEGRLRMQRSELLHANAGRSLRRRRRSGGVLGDVGLYLVDGLLPSRRLLETHRRRFMHCKRLFLAAELRLAQPALAQPAPAACCQVCPSQVSVATPPGMLQRP